jgi:hypothetical protein
MTKKKINCCWTVRPNRRGVPQDLGHKKMKLKWGDIRVRTRGDLMTVVWRDKRDVHMLTNIHNPPAEGNFCDENGSHSLWKIIIATWVMRTRETGWSIAIQSAATRGSGRRNYTSIGLNGKFLHFQRDGVSISYTVMTMARQTSKWLKQMTV